ncbi:predicted protein, partial [Nematostella vectensis]
VTETLLRKRAEHNNCEIFTLEEISLHQQEIERLELLDKLCRDLKILYLQSNLIPKIENVSRLKKLEYINLALNNITRIENLEGCESLKKLDLTVNFVDELTSIKSLKCNIHLQEMFLTGNPCTDYDGYREYVIATLTQLKWLDGKEVEKSERILALQEYGTVSKKIEEQQEAYKLKQVRNISCYYVEMAVFRCCCLEKVEYTPESRMELHKHMEEKRKRQDERDRQYWQEKVEYTPESRMELHKHMEEKRKRQDERDRQRLEGDQPKRVTKFFTEDGRPLNLNQGKLDFHLTDDEENNTFILDLACYKHVDTSLIDVDVQPHYVRAVIKGKAFQLVLSEEVKPDSSSAKRSQTTGHLLITMPKMKETIQPVKRVQKISQPKLEQKDTKTTNPTVQQGTKHERLEVGKAVNKEMDFSQIVENDSKKNTSASSKAKPEPKVELEKDNEDFVDDPEVPPLI